MSETLNVGLTKRQRDLLLRGLRFVRSSVLLEMREPGSDVEEDRGNELRDIASLVDQLNGAETANPTVKV